MTNRRTAAPFLVLALAACAPGNPTTTPTPGASAGSPGPKASTSASATPGGASAAPNASPSPAAGPAVPDTGTFAWQGGASARWVRTEKGATDGVPVKYVTFEVGEVKDGKASYAVKVQTSPTGTASTQGSGTFDVAAEPFYFFVDVNLNPKVGADVIATAQDQGAETVTVPAGTFACKKTRYQKDKGNGFVVDLTAWTNGQAGLVKAQVDSSATVAGTTLKSDIRWELEKRP